jgi:hypothetical protein
MGMEFGWWKKTEEDGKFHVHAVVHGGNIEWIRKQGHHTSWVPYVPTQDDWDQLIYEADKRLVRRLLSPKQLAVIHKLKEVGTSNT